MLDNFMAARQRGGGRWKIPLIVLSVVVHVGGIAAVSIASVWGVTKLPVPTANAAIHMGMGMPARPEAAKEKKKREPRREPKRVIKTTVQPPKNPFEDPPNVEPSDIDIGGDGDGDSDNTLISACTGANCGTGDSLIPTLRAPQPPPPVSVMNKQLEAQRIAGNTHIEPPRGVKSSIAREGRSRVITSVRFCLDTTGAMKSTRITRSSGYSDYDQRILRTMRAWRYRPYRVGETAREACASVTFVYRQAN